MSRIEKKVNRFCKIHAVVTTTVKQRLFDEAERWEKIRPANVTIGEIVVDLVMRHLPPHKGEAAGRKRPGRVQANGASGLGGAA
jgi:hypothetical protein